MSGGASLPRLNSFMNFAEAALCGTVPSSLLPHCKIKETISHLIHLSHTELIYNNKIGPLCSGKPSKKSSAFTETTWVRRDIFLVIPPEQDQSLHPSHQKADQLDYIKEKKPPSIHRSSMEKKKKNKQYATLKHLSCREIFSMCHSILPHTLSEDDKRRLTAVMQHWVPPKGRHFKRLFNLFMSAFLLYLQ